MICLSKTSLATIIGLADFVCQIDTERSSAPRATTEQILEVATGAAGLRRNMCGLYACGNHEFGPCCANRSTATYSYFHCVFMSNEAYFRCPTIAGNNSSNKHKSLVVGSIGSSDMCSIRRPTGSKD